MPSWFKKGINPGTILTLDQPVPSQWEIVKKLNEYDLQLSEEHHRLGLRLSLATTKLLCRDPKDHTKQAFMRIYLQVPYRGTEMGDADTRAKQATTLTPQELIAYQELTEKSMSTPKLLGYRTTTQDSSGVVPGGFVVWLVWEMDLAYAEREEIRASFVKALYEMRKIGYLPDTPALSSLVWHKESKTLYFIGFRYRNVGQPKGLDDDAKWIAMFELAIPNSDAWVNEEWDQNTSDWKW